MLSPTHVIFIIIYFFVSNYGPWVSTLDVVPFSSPSHPFTKHGEFDITILPHPTDAMLHAYECNHANSYIQFSCFICNYISYNSNNHVNTSIYHATTISFSPHQTCYSNQAIICKKIPMDEFQSNNQFGLHKAVQLQAVDCPRKVPIKHSVPFLWDRIAWPFLASQLLEPFSWLFRQEITEYKKTSTSRSLSKLHNPGTHA